MNTEGREGEGAKQSSSTTTSSSTSTSLPQLNGTSEGEKKSTMKQTDDGCSVSAFKREDA
ncbi:hypothetical protein CSUI_011043 [Cystoisospora suis]|uniref:Uncharacterized protein n=1 Tax=Cystoisospora suis TaxID=483139 RepID=A0A2C6KES1_9APIC|nr:hypothetical protein CSUI_011043 [Cystoisospora suis]